MAVGSDSGGTFLKSGVINFKAGILHLRVNCWVGCLGTSSARAVTVDVFAQANSSTGGAGALTGVFLTLGQAFTVSAGLDDLWSAGDLPRWSNADGLTGDRFATGTDESGEAANTKIGQNFGTWEQFSFSAPYGSLVGRIGSGDFFLVGTNFSDTANASGPLAPYYWDSNNGDNTGSIAANISASAVPGPIVGAGLPGVVMALGGLIAWRRRRMAAA
jgi:hypothetical protein